MSAHDRTFILIGHPVGHSISPPIHQAAYEALGLADCRYLAVDCPDEAAVADRVAAVRSGHLAGANVTVPHKRLALSLADDADDLARDVGAANVLTRSASGRVVAHNTDVAALADELRSGAAGARTATVIGAGGAALGAVVACRLLGAREIAVTARRWTASTERSHWAGADEVERLGATPTAWPTDLRAEGDWHRVVTESNVIVQATSAGMQGADSGQGVCDVVPWTDLADGVFVYDVVYNPPLTPFLEAARASGCAGRGGLGMLVGQAAHAIEIWLDREAPVAEMQAAAQRALFGGVNR